MRSFPPAASAALPALLLPGLLLPAAPALAHAVLVASTPPVDGTVAPGHAAIELRYNSLIDRGRSAVTLTGPDGAQNRLAIGRDGPRDVIQTGADLPAPGAYTLRWQVLAVDGHITRGDVHFTVKAP